VTFDEVEEAVASNVTRYHAHEVRGDLHYSDALAPRLRARGIAYVEVPMSPSAQEGRAKTLAAMFSSRAVTLLDNPTLVSELKDLRVQRHAGGRVSVGASGSRHDDAADTLLLLAEASAGLPAVGGDAGVVEFIHDGVGWTEEGVESRNPRWVRALPNGRSELVEYPRWAAGWEDYAREQIALGCRTPEIMRWEAEQLQQGRGINVAIED
jgi:hypothetical protein